MEDPVELAERLLAEGDGLAEAGDNPFLRLRLGQSPDDRGDGSEAAHGRTPADREADRRVDPSPNPAM